jgi:hypothetical protein
MGGPPIWQEIRVVFDVCHQCKHLVTIVPRCCTDLHAHKTSVARSHTESASRLSCDTNLVIFVLRLSVRQADPLLLPRDFCLPPLPSTKSPSKQQSQLLTLPQILGNQTVFQSRPVCCGSSSGSDTRAKRVSGSPESYIHIELMKCFGAGAGKAQVLLIAVLNKQPGKCELHAIT